MELIEFCQMELPSIATNSQFQVLAGPDISTIGSGGPSGSAKGLFIAVLIIGVFVCVAVAIANTREEVQRSKVY